MLKKFKSMINMALLLTAAVAITSCEKTEGDDLEYVAPSGKLAGEWFVTLKDGGVNALTAKPNTVTGVAVLKPYVKLMTFNDVSKSDSLWAQTIDVDYIDPVSKTPAGVAIPAAERTYTTSFATKAAKVKTLSSPASMIFGVTAGKNIVKNAVNTITILNAKVLSGQGKSLSGNTVDSIYLEVQYSNFPGKTFVLSGHQRSGFPADEPHF